MTNYNSDYDVRLKTLAKLGGDVTKKYDSIYEIDIEILRLTAQGGGGATYTAGQNISIDANNAISADGYLFNGDTDGGFAEKYKQDSGDGGQIVNNTATGLGSHAEGYGTTASGDYGAHAEGCETSASMDSAHAEGFRTTASGDYGAHAEGSWTSAMGNSSHTEGYGTQNYPIQALGAGSHAEGVGRIARNEAEHAEGMFGVSHKSSDNFGDAGNTLHSIGNSYSRNNFHNAVEVMLNGDVYITGIGGYLGTDTKVQDATIKTLQDAVNSKQDTLTAGQNINIDANNTISADGYEFNGDTNGGFAEKYKQDAGDGGQVLANTANALGAHAEGYNTTASGDYGSHAEGNVSVASGYVSHAEGNRCTATGVAAHAEGIHTTASSKGAHAEGAETNATGIQSHAEGGFTTAQGLNSHAEGEYTIATNLTEHSEGCYNISHKANDTYGNAGNTQHSVGIGSPSTHKNAFEIMQNGDMYVYGVGGYVGTDTKVQDATIKTLQDYIASLEARIAVLEGNTTVS